MTVSFSRSRSEIHSKLNMWTVATIFCSLVVTGATASAIPNNFNETFSHSDSPMSRTKRIVDIFVDLIICTTQCTKDEYYEFEYEEQHHEFGSDAEEEVSNPYTCGDLSCEVTLTNTVQRSDMYTKTVKMGWSADLTSKISEAFSLKLGHSGEVSWAWSHTRMVSASTARKCAGRPGQRITVMFKPKYQISEGLLHKRASKLCKDFCNTKDEPSEAYKIKSYGKRGGYLVGEEKCRTEGGEQQQPQQQQGTDRGNSGSNCRGTPAWGARYDQWCATNCVMNNCPEAFCTCS